ncbi:MAG: STAS domain-containing protein [Spirochaetota bacterium]
MKKPQLITLKLAFLDGGNKDRFIGSLREQAGDCAWAVVDLGGLDFIDSSGMGALIALARDLEERGGELVLASPSPTVKAAFELVYLKLKIRIFDDVEAASKAIGEARGEE